MTNNVTLRNVKESDLPTFFDHQRDPESIRMAAFPSREKDAFMAHWAKIRADESVIIKTILFDRQIAGNILCFEMLGQKEIGYWLGREFCGKGIASRALSKFLEQIKTRPLYAHVVKHNIGSRRVLEKNRFVVCGEDKVQDQRLDKPIEEFILVLK